MFLPIEVPTSASTPLKTRPLTSDQYLIRLFFLSNYPTLRWACLIRPILKAFRFSWMLAKTTLNVFGFCMQQREASRKAQCVQRIGGLDSGEDLCICRVNSALTGNQMQECTSFWSCLIRPSLKVFKFSRIDMARYSEFAKGTSLNVFGFCMQKRAASRTVQDFQPFGGLVCS